jgi:hypothetical protein
VKGHWLTAENTRLITFGDRVDAMLRAVNQITLTGDALSIYAIDVGAGDDRAAVRGHCVAHYNYLPCHCVFLCI